MRLVSAVLAAILIAGPASAQYLTSKTPAPTDTTRDRVATIGSVNAAIGGQGSASQLPLDIRQPPFNAVCNGSDVSAAFNAAVTAGYTNILIPSGCTLVTSSIAAGLTVTGQGYTSLIEPATPTVTALSLGAGVRLFNLGLFDSHCYASVDPVNTTKVCLQGAVYVNDDNGVNPGGWVGTPVVVYTGPTYTVGGVTSSDLQGFVVVSQSTGGDNFFTQTGGSGNSGMRGITASAVGGDQFLYCLDGQAQPAQQHICGFLKEFGTTTTATSDTLYIDRASTTGSTQESLRITDIDTGGGQTNTSSYINLVTSHQVSGNLFSVFQATQAFSGDVFHANMGNSGGTFSGNYFNYTNGGTTEFKVDNNGNMTIGGSLSGPNGLGNTLVASSGIAFIMPGGTPSMGNNCAITALASLPETYANAYIYLPANAISAGSAAGWNFFQMSSATAGTCYNNQYTGPGVPTIPASPTPYATTGPGAWTPVITEQTGPNFTLAGNAMGKNGSVQFRALAVYPNNADNKTLRLKFGGNNAFAASGTTTTAISPISDVQNRGLTGTQITNGTGVSGGGLGTSTNAPATFSVDTTQPVTIGASLQIGVAASDFMVLDFFKATLSPSSP